MLATPEISIVNTLIGYGPPGVVIIVLLYYIRYLTTRLDTIQDARFAEQKQHSKDYADLAAKGISALEVFKAALERRP